MRDRVLASAESRMTCPLGPTARRPFSRTNPGRLIIAVVTAVLFMVFGWIPLIGLACAGTAAVIANRRSPVGFALHE